jgi:anti-anti-sigma factor
VFVRTVAGRPFSTAVTVVVAGEVDLAEMDAFRDAVVGAADDHTTAIVLDLDGVTFLGSSGLGALIGARLQLDERGIVMSIESCSPVVTRVLEATGIAGQLGRPGTPDAVA